MDQTVYCPFRVVAFNTFPTAVSVTITELDLIIANLGARVIDVAAAYEWFRFHKLHAYQYTSAVGPSFVATKSDGLNSGSHALAWVDSDSAATGTAVSLVQMAQYEKFIGGSVYEKLKLTMSSAQLAAVPYKWYATSSGGTASDETSPGLFVTYVQNDGPIEQNMPSAILVVEGVIQFRGMITPALQMAGMKPRQPRPSCLSVEQKNENVDSDDDCSVVSQVAKREPCLMTANSTSMPRDGKSGDRGVYKSSSKREPR